MGRLAQDDGTRYEVEKLRERHEEVLRLIALGLENKDIAAMLGVSEAMVSYTRNGNLGKRKLGDLTKARDASVEAIMEEIQQLTPLAVDVLEEVMSNPMSKDADRIRAAQDVLDRSGLAAVQKFDVRQTLVAVTAKELEEMKERAEEMRRRRAENSIEVSVKTSSNGGSEDGNS